MYRAQLGGTTVGKKAIFVGLLVLAFWWGCAKGGGSGATPGAQVPDPTPTPTPSTLHTIRIASGLSWPVYATMAPGDSTRMFIVEKAGRIKILNMQTGQINSTLFLDIDSLVTGGFSNGDEQGLLGLVFHPNYASNGFFYVCYTDNSSHDVVQRFHVSANPNVADPASGLMILSVNDPFGNHNGGWIGFGPDGLLYIAMGDGGSGDDPGNRAQTITNQLLGKMLRIDINRDDFPADANRNYGIPANNPFVGVTGDDEIWAYGLRNPWRCSFDRETGDFYIGDVGQGAKEEIDFIAAGSSGVKNFGWRCMEGSDCTGLTGCACNDASLTMPIAEYEHNCNSGGFAVMGGYVYRGTQIADLQGQYFYADYVCNHIWSIKYNGQAVTESHSWDSQLLSSQDGFPVDQISSFAEDLAGELYIIDQGNGSDGQIFKIVP